MWGRDIALRCPRPACSGAERMLSCVRLSQFIAPLNAARTAQARHPYPVHGPNARPILGLTAPHEPLHGNGAFMRQPEPWTTRLPAEAGDPSAKVHQNTAVAKASNCVAMECSRSCLNRFPQAMPKSRRPVSSRYSEKTSPKIDCKAQKLASKTWICLPISHLLRRQQNSIGSHRLVQFQ